MSHQETWVLKILLQYLWFCMLGKVAGVVAFHGDICRVRKDRRLKNDSVRAREAPQPAKCMPLQAGGPETDH